MNIGLNQPQPDVVRGEVRNSTNNMKYELPNSAELFTADSSQYKCSLRQD